MSRSAQELHTRSQAIIQFIPGRLQKITPKPGEVRARISRVYDSQAAEGAAGNFLSKISDLLNYTLNSKVVIITFSLREGTTLYKVPHSNGMKPVFGLVSKNRGSMYEPGGGKVVTNGTVKNRGVMP
jgi:hypothetical protein